MRNSKYLLFQDGGKILYINAVPYFYWLFLECFFPLHTPSQSRCFTKHNENNDEKVCSNVFMWKCQAEVAF